MISDSIENSTPAPEPSSRKLSARPAKNANPTKKAAGAKKAPALE